MATVADMKPGQHWISVTHGMSGHFAVEYWMNNENPDLGVFQEPYDTGFGRYNNKEQAIIEASGWANFENLPLIL